MVNSWGWYHYKQNCIWQFTMQFNMLVLLFNLSYFLSLTWNGCGLKVYFTNSWLCGLEEWSDSLMRFKTINTQVCLTNHLRRMMSQLTKQMIFWTNVLLVELLENIGKNLFKTSYFLIVHCFVPLKINSCIIIYRYRWVQQ